MDDQEWVPGISVVCVFNDPEVRRECLDRSLADYHGEVEVDYIPVDNTRHDFSSAGAALNHGAALARYDVVVFVHQDVYLHSIDRIAAVGAELYGDRWGLLGANGVPSEGQFVGRLRDRVQVIGSNADSPAEVDSVDEVLFMVRRDRLLAEPLIEEPELAWHAYAVEYGLRLRRLGLGVGAVNLAVTHNSLTINLDRLDVAHRRVAGMYPDQLPVRSTCGVIGPRPSTWKDAPVMRDHRWRFGWLIRSLRSLRGRRNLDVPVVLSDIRTDVDLLGFSEQAPLNVVNLDRAGGFAAYAHRPVRLTRAGSPVIFWAAATIDELLATIVALPTSESVLVADLTIEDLPNFDSHLPDQSNWLLGMHEGATWLLGGPVVHDLPAEWSEPRAVPLGGGRRRRSHYQMARDSRDTPAVDAS